MLLLLEHMQQCCDVGDPLRVLAVPAAVQGVRGEECQVPERAGGMAAEDGTAVSQVCNIMMVQDTHRYIMMVLRHSHRFI